MKIYTDAAYDVKTGTAGLAVIVHQAPQNLIYKYYHSQLKDNHAAEFLAFFLAVQQTIVINPDPDLLRVFHTDSKIVAQSIEKRYCKQETYRHYLDKLLPLWDSFSLAFVKWIPEKDNRAADHAAKQALMKQGNYQSLSD